MLVEGRRRHAAGPPAHTRAGECQALVGSGGSRAHRASSPAQGAAGARQRGGAVLPPRWAQVTSLQGGGHRPLPARPHFPPISTCGATHE